MPRRFSTIPLPGEGPIVQATLDELVTMFCAVLRRLGIKIDTNVLQRAVQEELPKPPPPPPEPPTLDLGDPNVITVTALKAFLDYKSPRKIGERFLATKQQAERLKGLGLVRIEEP
jgi:hypothetical protein